MKITANIKTLDQLGFQEMIEYQLSPPPVYFETTDQASEGISGLTDVLNDTFLAQGKTFPNNVFSEGLMG